MTDVSFLLIFDILLTKISGRDFFADSLRGLAVNARKERADAGEEVDARAVACRASATRNSTLPFSAIKTGKRCMTDFMQKLQVRNRVEAANGLRVECGLA